MKKRATAEMKKEQGRKSKKEQANCHGDKQIELKRMTNTQAEDLKQIEQLFELFVAGIAALGEQPAAEEQEEEDSE